MSRRRGSQVIEKEPPEKTDSENVRSVTHPLRFGKSCSIYSQGDLDGERKKISFSLRLQTSLVFSPPSREDECAAIYLDIHHNLGGQFRRGRSFVNRDVYVFTTSFGNIRHKLFLSPVHPSPRIAGIIVLHATSFQMPRRRGSQVIEKEPPEKNRQRKLEKCDTSFTIRKILQHLFSGDLDGERKKNFISLRLQTSLVFSPPSREDECAAIYLDIHHNLGGQFRRGRSFVNRDVVML
ncbi:hypothetical protein CEXT_692701 [Caerostris extrusa]|uniref:Uncharacterized protein n=1 Tax=Caerostris extrusa TaxID=172846 RepID=A0AAV4QMS8_CAEEX|nr:hypothetical protein CEXT_692701 [Caerostris extrusa]